jgi:hypothetical protein
MASDRKALRAVWFDPPMFDIIPLHVQASRESGRALAAFSAISWSYW